MYILLYTIEPINKYKMNSENFESENELNDRFSLYCEEIKMIHNLNMENDKNYLGIIKYMIPMNKNHYISISTNYFYLYELHSYDNYFFACNYLEIVKFKIIKRFYEKIPLNYVELIDSLNLILSNSDKKEQILYNSDNKYYDYLMKKENINIKNKLSNNQEKFFG